MIITTTLTLTLEYRLEDREIEEFRNKVLEYIQYELEEETITIDDIPAEKIKEYLSSELPNIIEEIKQGYCDSSGVKLDDYFNTISLDYYDEDTRYMIQECANEIRKER